MENLKSKEELLELLDEEVSLVSQLEELGIVYQEVPMKKMNLSEEGSSYLFPIEEGILEIMTSGDGTLLTETAEIVGFGRLQDIIRKHLRSIEAITHIFLNKEALD